MGERLDTAVRGASIEPPREGGPGEASSPPPGGGALPSPAGPSSGDDVRTGGLSHSRRSPSRALLGTLLLTTVAVACADRSTAPDPAEVLNLSRPWVSADPATVGIDTTQLDRAAAAAGAIPRFRSLLVVRDGRLVLERYFGGTGPEDLADVRSVTKSVVSTLVGIALQMGYLDSLDQTLGETLPTAVGTLRQDEKTITVRDLLTMTGGWAWDESTAAGYNEWVLATDHVQYLLDRPLADSPGSTFTYNSAAVHLLGVLLEEVTGMSLPAFADKVLFGPLGISAREWEDLGDGRVNGGSGLRLRPRDLARIGQLFLQSGVSGHRNVVSTHWVDEAARPHFAWTADAGSTHVSYGYLWWTDVDHDAFMARGYRGQIVYVAPSRRLVVVTTTAWGLIDGQSAPADLDRQALSVVVDGVLPAAPAQ